MSDAGENSHRASDPRKSVWVSANAGAGKTYVLTNRVTRLLLDGASPARILCLTYTKAAAAEMQSRLFDQLGKWALLSDSELKAALSKIGATELDPETLRAARRLFARALETPGGLKIQTIHSFCQHVLARFPVEAGIPTRFRVLDERSAVALMTEARIAVLTRAADDAALKQAVSVLATRARDERFADILNAAVGSQSSKLRDILARHGNDETRLAATVRAKLGVAADDDPDAMAAHFCAELGDERGQCQTIVAWLTGGGPADNDSGDALGSFLTSATPGRAIEHLARLFLTAKGPRQSLATNALRRAQPQHAEYLQQLQQRFLAFYASWKAATTAVLTEALLKIAAAVLEEYDAKKRARATLDYDDLIRHTLALLQDRANATWVLYKLDGGLDHILVDEAQDTSPDQWRIVARLVEDFFAGESSREKAERPPTIFAVGDEKQSIFSFQGADPNAFADNLAEFQSQATAARMAFEPVELDASYRGARDVLRFVDEVFSDEITRAMLTAKGGVIGHTPDRKDVAGRVEFWPPVSPPPEEPEPKPGDALDTPAADTAYKRLAKQIADRIQRWIDAGFVLPSTKRPLQAGDIMILVRRRGAFAEEMIRQLMELKDPRIAVAGADRMTLSEQIAIMDLVALGRFALLPGDNLNLAALLKSPLIRLTEDELFILAHKREGSLWSALARRHAERPAFAQAYERLSAALRRADHVPPFEFYSQVLTHGVREALVMRLGAEAADAIDEFLALALMHESAHAPSLESFLHWFGQGASEVKRDMEQGGGAVRVMTVHGAKGLQAPVVIVPDTTQVPDLAARSGLLFTEDCMFFGVNKNMETQPITDAKRAAHAAEMREYMRLLYVALTRAQDWLVVCGYETKLKPPIHPQSWYPLVGAAAGRIMREEKDIAGEPIAAFGASLAEFAKEESAPKERKAARPEFLKKPAPSEPAGQRVLQPSQVSDAGEPPVFSPFDDQGFRFRRGLLVHSLLAALPDIAAADRENAALRFLKLRGVEEAEAKALASEALAILNRADFAPLFTPDSRGEVPISVELPELGAGTRISGQVDRMAVTADAVLVADYKTNRPPSKNVDAVPGLYRAQMALYRAALAKIYPGKRIECALVWTDGPTFMRLPDAMLDAEIAQITSRTVG